MDHTTHIPDITQVVTYRHDELGIDYLVLYVHHTMKPEEIDTIMRAVEIMIPSILELAATL